MADFSPTEVTQLLQALQQGGGFDAAIQDALSALSAVEGAAPIPKEQKKVADLILKLIPQSLQAELRRDIAAGNTGVALAKLQAQPQILQMRIAGGIELEQAKGARQIAVGEAKVEQDVLRKQLLGEAEIKLEAKRAAAAIPAIDPRVQTFIDKEVVELEEIIRNKDKPLPSQTELNARLKAIDLENTSGKTSSQLLQGELSLRREQARVLTERALAEQAPRATALGSAGILLEDAATTGIPASPKAIQAAEQAAVATEAQAQRLGEVGVQVRREGGRLQLVEGALQPEDTKKRFLPTGPTEKVRQLVKQAEAARLAGNPVKAAEITKSIPGGRFKAGAGKGGAIAAGIAALLLLPKLLGGGNEQAQGAQQQALQLQMLQQAQQSQNQNALTQSLVQSRGSQAGLNNARSQLLQLQALQAAGAGGGGLV